VRELVDDALVLRTFRSGEADRIAVLFTRHRGKVRVLAKGARKSTSRLGGALEVLGHVGVDLVATRGDLFIARHVAHKTNPTTLRGDYERIGAGYAVVEALDALPDGLADPAVFDLAVRVLATLDDPGYLPELVPASFYLRLLALDGSAPVLDACVECGREFPLVAFDAETGGVRCASCRRGRALSPEALALVRRIAGGDLATVLREVDPPGAGEVAALAHEAAEAHLGRPLRAARATAPAWRAPGDAS
jgi:DNA repair protein RecO (recombination protein O)